MDWKKVGKALLFPHPGILITLTFLSGGLLVAAFAMGQPIWAYGVYALSFYTLCVDCLYCILKLPKDIRQLRDWIYSKPLGNRYMTDPAFRSKVSVYLSCFINVLYVAINLWSWFWVGSNWFWVLAVYYAIMSLMRLLLAEYMGKHAPGEELLREWQRSRVCAYVLLLINLSLSGAVLMILYQNRGYDYPGILIYVMALYTFYSTGHTISELIRYRKGSPILATAKLVSLSAALVSMLNLETAMFAQFGKDMPPDRQRLMIILTGAGISITVITLSVLHILHANKAIKHLHK